MISSSYTNKIIEGAFSVTYCFSSISLQSRISLYPSVLFVSKFLMTSSLEQYEVLQTRLKRYVQDRADSGKSCEKRNYIFVLHLFRFFKSPSSGHFSHSQHACPSPSFVRISWPTDHCVPYFRVLILVHRSTLAGSRCSGRARRICHSILDRPFFAFRRMIWIRNSE